MGREFLDETYLRRWIASGLGDAATHAERRLFVWAVDWADFGAVSGTRRGYWGDEK